MRALFILIRHAESPWSSDESRPLSAAGRRAAAKLADRLSSIDVATIYSSPYARARETVEPLAARLGLPVKLADELRERSIGSIADIGFDEVVNQSWREPDKSWPGGESLRQAQIRIASFVHSLAESSPPGVIALSTHGGVLAALLNHFDSRVDAGFWRSLTFPDAFELQFTGPRNGTFNRL